MRPPNRTLSMLLLSTLAAASAGVAQSVRDTTHAPLAGPPEAERLPRMLEAHGDVRVDPYFWLRERENPDVIAYLEAENAWTEQQMAHTAAFRDELFREMRGRIVEDEETVPFFEDGYWYYTRFEEGAEYPLLCRREGSLDAPEQVMLDVNRLAGAGDFLSVSSHAVSPDGRVLAFAADTVGRRFYTIRFKDLRSGEMLPDAIDSVTASLAWANDGRTLFYAKQDPETLRWDRIYRHELGTDPAGDALVYEETDETFSAYVFRTKSDRFVMIGSSQTLADEYRYVDADRPHDPFRVLLPRERGHEHAIFHLGDHFYFLTNDEAPNRKLVRAPVDRPDREHWEEVVPHRDDVLLENVELFRDFLVTSERRDGLTRLHVRRWNGRGEHDIVFDDPAYVAYAFDNREMDTSVLRFGYQSLATPATTFDYDMATRERTLRKRQEVRGGFDPAAYTTERLHVPTHDGVRVPVSLVYRTDLRPDGPAPLLLYGYGSYGATIEPGFNSTRLSLLDRGFVYAIAHVRGSETLGRDWYDRGKLFHKRNTFTDFNAVADHLVRYGYTAPDRLYAMGGSAGGLLMGAIANMRPDLYDGIVAEVPWVDVVTTMLDASIPLTTSEYDEWGDPNDPDAYEYMLSYSPYDNVAEQAYPHLLVTTGLHDSQVQYWEPAKWVAKLRATKTDDNRLLLRTNMEAGHGGASGRFERFHETAFVYAFLLDLAGKLPVS